MHTDPRPLNLGIIEASRVLGVGRSKLYGLISEGRLRTVRIGRRRLVPAAALVEFQAELERPADARHATTGQIGGLVSA